MRFKEYLDNHYTFYRTLTLQLGLHCPSRCRHCSVFAAPGHPKVMSPDMARSAISEFAKLPDASVVVLTGGEPFAMPEVFRTALEEIAKHHKLRAYVITSASWASALHVACETLVNLPYIALMTVSADIYHEEFIPLENVRHCLEAVVSLGRDVMLSIAVDDTRPGYADRVRACVGEQLWGIIETEVLPIHPTGRARNLGIGRFDTIPEPLPEGACDFLGTPVVVHDGTVVACCQIDTVNQAPQRPTSPYVLGNLRNTQLASMREMVDRDPVFQALRVWGPKELVKLLRANGVDLHLAERYDGVCFLCRDIMQNPVAVAALRQTLSSPEYSNEIRLLRMLQYGELRTRPAEWKTL